jgi:hypothetical protein
MCPPATASPLGTTGILPAATERGPAHYMDTRLADTLALPWCARPRPA